MDILHSLITRRRFGPQTEWRPLRKTLTSGLGLDDMSLACNFLAYSRINHEYSSLFIIVINLIFIFLLWYIDWVGSLYANRFVLCISVLRVASGPRVKLSSCKSGLTPVPRPPSHPHPTPHTPRPRCFTLLTVLKRWSRCYSLLLCGLFYEAICFMSYLVLFCTCVFQSF